MLCLSSHHRNAPIHRIKFGQIGPHSSCGRNIRNERQHGDCESRNDHNDAINYRYGFEPLK